MSTRIIFNGKEYRGVNDMPADVREAYERIVKTFDANQNGIPDVIEKLPELEKLQVSSTQTDQRIVVNGQTYRNVEEMPTEVRQLYEESMKSAQVGPEAVSKVTEKAIFVKKTGLGTAQRVETRIVLNGKEYRSVNEMPAVDRQAYEQLMGRIDANRNGIPDVLEKKGLFGVLTGGLKFDIKIQTTSTVSSPSAKPEPGAQGAVRPPADRWANLRPVDVEARPVEPAAVPPPPTAGKKPHPLAQGNPTLRIVVVVLTIILVALLGLLGYLWLK